MPTTTSPDALKHELARTAAELGFARVGVARAAALGEEGERLRHWLARERHGQMAYMQRTAEVRIDPAHAGMLPSARSVVVLAAPYAQGEPPPSLEPGRIARYALGRDYHNVLHKRLRKLARLLRARGHEARSAVDSMPVYERAWAARAGVGFIGKNCCLIVPGLGSHVFLACLVTSAELPPDAPMAERCGDCRRCLDACPTRAFAAARELDARRCISYLTIELRGAVDEALRPQIGQWLFGCDVCQDVCPFNATKAPDPALTQPFAPGERLAGCSAEHLVSLDEQGFARLAQGSALKRAGREGLARNAATVLANAGARRSLPVLRVAAERDPAQSVRQTARWAIERLGG
jgi:epoxyqueuosine reductase